MPEVLHDYQAKAVADARHVLYEQDRDSVLIVAPTGAGKTHISCDIIARSVPAEIKTWVIVHRDHLVEQFSDRLKRFGVDHGVIAPNRAEQYEKLVQVCSVFTLPHRQFLPSELPEITHFDEAHHLAANTWQKIRTMTRGAKHLGYTATPIRGDGKGLATTYGSDGSSNLDGFDAMILTVSPVELVRLGVLVEPIVKQPPSDLTMKGARKKKSGDFNDKDVVSAVRSSHITGDAVAHYLSNCPNTPGVVFCANVELAIEQAEEFNKAGVPAAALYGEMSFYQKRAVLEQLANGTILIVTSCDLISEGFDLPVCGYVGLCRPTASLGLYLQQVGRALRGAPGKEFAYVLDHAGNSKRFGHPLITHQWTLDGIDRKQAKEIEEQAKALKRCPQCFTMNYAIRDICQACGAPLPKNRCTLETHDGELILLEFDENQAALAEKALKKKRLGQRLHEATKSLKLSDFQAIAKDEGYKPGWAQVMWQRALRRRKRANA